MAPDPIRIHLEYVINLSKFNFEAKIPISSKVKENPAANNAIFIVVYTKFPVDAL